MDIGGAASSAMQTAKDFLSGNITAGEVMGKVKTSVQAGAQKAADLNLGQVMMGSIKNKLGRPALYAFDSLLTGAKVGLWHVTIGNPKNPIATFGNLIMTNAKITHSGPLGFDDFPTDLHVSVTLKHAMSRDATEISKMYTKGQNGIYFSLCSPFNTIEFNDGEKARSNISLETPPATPPKGQVNDVTKKQNQNKENQKNADNEKKDDDKDLIDDEINNSKKDKPLDLIPGKANTAFDSPSTTQYTRFAWSGCDTEEYITSKDEMR